MAWKLHLACTMSTPLAPPDDSGHAPQQVVKVRRDYNSWVATETMEDYALRYTPQRFRKWSEWRVANTAFGAASFLILEAVGATLLVQYGFINAFWAIVATGLIIFLAGLPISVYAARYGVDMDLLTRGAGFGYIGSTLTSLIYASFTFILFAIEASIMSTALEMALGLPFDERAATIPHTEGRVEGSRNEYVVGWIKRGPSGVIGSNKKDSQDTVDTLVADLAGASLREVSADYADELVRWLLDRQPALVTDDHWQLIDAHERSAGEPHGRPRVKLASVAELLRIGHG